MTLKKEKPSAKLTVDLKDAWIDVSMGKGCEFLWGIPVNHPSELMNGKITHTSYIVSLNGNVVETKRSVYNILNWDENKVHPQAELFN